MSTVPVTLVGCTSSTAPSLPIGISPCREKYSTASASWRLWVSRNGRSEESLDWRISSAVR